MSEFVLAIGSAAIVSIVGNYLVTKGFVKNLERKEQLRPKRFEVWYRIVSDFKPYEPTTFGEVLSDYVKVCDIYAPSKEGVFEKMQGDNWSPHGEGRRHIQNLGLRHTSLSVGDLIRDEKGYWWVCDESGFKMIRVWGS